MRKKTSHAFQDIPALFETMIRLLKFLFKEEEVLSKVLDKLSKFVDLISVPILIVKFFNNLTLSVIIFMDSSF